jgi:uncharacterized protein YjiS (DUF1127 family)
MPQFMRQTLIATSSVSLFHGKAPQLEELGAFEKLMQLMERAHQRRALLELEEDQLDDIGITRAEARREAGKRFWE